MEKPYVMDAAEKFWIGPERPEKHTVYRMSQSSTEQEWLAVPDGIELEEYSEFSVRIHCPKARSLSFIYRTIAILPKQHLRSIYNLIGEYLK